MRPQLIRFLLLILAIAPLAASAQPLAGLHYALQSVPSGKYISVGANSMAKGSWTILWDSPTNAHEDGQAYRFIPKGDYYVIEVRNKFGLCLGVSGAVAGSYVVMMENNGSDDVLWKLVPNGEHFTLEHKASGMVVNLSGEGTANGAPVILWNKLGYPNEQWRLVPAKEEFPYWENLGSAINTPRAQTGPCFSPDGKTLYFSIGDNQNGVIPNGDIYIATLGPSGQWENIQPVPELNNDAHNMVVGVYPGGNTLLLFGDYSGGTALYSITHRSANGWTRPEPLDIRYPKLTQYVWSGTIGSDGKTIVVDINTTGRQNESDMYVTFLDARGKWSKLLDLGPKINRPYAWDGTPYLSPDMRTLYFNSTRGNDGGSEFYVARRLDDTWTNWTEPEKMNLKMSPGSFLQFFSVPGDGRYAYFISWSKTFGEGDLFRLAMDAKQQPEPFMVVNGRTLDKETQQPISAKVAFEDLGTGTTLGHLTSNPATGEFQIILPRGRNYGIFSEAAGYYSQTGNLDASQLTAHTTVAQDILMLPVKAGSVIRLNNVFFDFGKATLRSESNAELNRVAAYLVENKQLKIEVAGHTDHVGDNAANLALSQSRADAVRDYLIQNGVDQARVVSKGYGEEVPVDTNDTEEGRQQNRRVEIKFLD